MRRLLLIALLALIGCKGGWTKCKSFTVWPTDDDHVPVTLDDTRYRVVGADPLVVEWQGPSAGVIKAEKVYCYQGRN